MTKSSASENAATMESYFVYDLCERVEVSSIFLIPYLRLQPQRLYCLRVHGLELLI